MLQWRCALVVQWIEQARPKGLMSVRFWPRALTLGAVRLFGVVLDPNSIDGLLY